MANQKLSSQAQSGFAAAADYDAYRPSYPDEAIEQLLQGLEIKGVAHAKVIDLAAGTGKFTEVIANRPENYEIIAVEPHDGLRQQLENKNLRGVRIINSTAENMAGVPDGSQAALVAAQSFHWFSNEHALKEIYRVLQPTGVFGMIWNVEDYNAPRSWDIHDGWESKMRETTWTFDDNQPRFRHEKWRQVFEDQSKSNPLTLHFADPLFSLPLGEGSVPFEYWLPKEEIWNRYRTLSQISVLRGDELESVRKTFFDAINAEDTATDLDGKVALHGQTFFAWTTRIPGEPLRSGG